MQDYNEEVARKELLEYAYTVEIIYGLTGKRVSIYDAEILSLSRFDVANDLESIARTLRE